MSMIERAAKAMYERMEGERTNIVAEWEDLSDFVSMQYIAGARAAIEAMREPTQDVAISGATVLAQEALDVDNYTDTATECWRTMIDAALKPPAAKEPPPIEPDTRPTVVITRAMRG